MRFKMNWAQEELFDNLWHRNNILKARQLGMSTLTSLLILDGCLFTSLWHAGIIDKTMDDAIEKLGKIKFAYNALGEPPTGEDWIDDDGDRAAIERFSRSVFQTAGGRFKEKKGYFANGSTVRIGISLRGGTIQFLHISEFGHVAAHYPKKAREVLSGALQTVDQQSVIVMESTHEGGKTGQNYRMTKRAMEKVGSKLNPLDYKFFFFPWWKQPEYRAESAEPLALSDSLRDYFHSLEGDGIVLSDAQKRWYAAQESALGFVVRQEFPSTPAEAFDTAIEDAIYGAQIAALRADGRTAREFEADDEYPLYTSWDLGLADYTALWLIQPRGDGIFYVLDYYICNNVPLNHYVEVVREWERVHGQKIARNFLPHDGHKAQDMYTELSSRDELLMRQGLSVSVVPRTRDVKIGINQVRMMLRHCVFHARCNESRMINGIDYMCGINALEHYQWLPRGTNGAIHEQPLHNDCSHAADAFRTFAEAMAHGFVSREVDPRLRGYESPNTGRSGMARGVPWGR